MFPDAVAEVFLAREHRSEVMYFLRVRQNCRRAGIGRRQRESDMSGDMTNREQRFGKWVLTRLSRRCLADSFWNPRWGVRSRWLAGNWSQ